jgi:photosystem II stability/assembly factor-like uncharacterized protein
MSVKLAPVYLEIAVGFLAALPLLGGGWEALGPFGGAAAIVQVDPFHTDTVVAAASDGLLFRSDDAAATWRPVPFPGALHGVLRAFLVDPRQPDTYWAGFSGDVPQASGLLRTTDAGKTWQALPGMRGREVWSLAVWRRDAPVLAVGTASGVYLTRDDGQNWQLIADPGNDGMAVVVSLAFDPLDSNVLFAGTPHLAWKTSNGGVTWRPVYNGMLNDSDVFSISVDPVHPQRVFASACSGIYRSRNAGALWSKLIGARGASYRTYFVGLDPREQDTVFAGTRRGLVKSTDGGATWRQLSTHSTRFVAFDPSHPGRIYVATDDDGIERSDDEGETLHAMNQGFCNRQLAGMLADGDALFTHTIYDSGSGGIFRLPAKGASWERLAAAPRLNGDELQALIPDGTASRWYGAAYSSLVVSADRGEHWNPLPALPKSRIADLFYTARGGYLLAATDAGLYRSADGGVSWKSVALPAPGGRLEAFFPLESDRVAALSPNGIFISKDGMLWEAAAPLPDHAEPHGIVESGSLFVATSSGLEQSEDDGRTWRLVRGGLPASTVQAICQHPTQPGVLAVAQFDTVYESQDNGRSWTRISPNEPHLSIREMTILPGSAELFVLTERQGIFALPLEARAPDASN